MRRQYRSNPNLLGLPNNGRKTYDDYTGAPSYENFMSTDDYGNKYDNRKPSSGDTDDDSEEMIATFGVGGYPLGTSPNGGI